MTHNDKNNTQHDNGAADGDPSGVAAESGRRVAILPPPSSNRGVLTPVSYASVDWVTYSYPHCREEFTEKLNVLKCALQCGNDVLRIRDYTGSSCCLNGFIGTRSNTDGTYDTLINLPGQSMQWLRLNGISDQKLLLNLGKYDGRCTRIDFAVDTTHGKASPLTCARAWRERRVCTNSLQGMPYCMEFTDKDGLTKGKTWDLGSRKADRFMRVYEKVAQMKQLGAECIDENGEIFDHLTRFELQSRGDVANISAEYFRRGGYKWVGELFRGFFHIVSREGYIKNVTRLDRHPHVAWYDEVFGEGVTWRPGLHRVATPEKTLQHLKKQYATTLATVRDYGFASDVKTYIDNAKPITEKKALEWEAFAKLHGRTIKKEIVQKQGVSGDDCTQA